ncbi:isochorismatase hydrolase [Burkholderia sp. H160]|nr:isochorismatase hydrolase [Burkholderia sp. H160]
MPVALENLVDPASTAVLCMEAQRGVVGDLSPIAELADVVQSSGMASSLAALLQAARSAGAQVVYCNAMHRRDRKGSVANAPILARLAKSGDNMIEGTAATENLPEVAPRPEDFVSARYHGMSPFTGTSLDAALRNMGIRTVIATGVSLNVGIIALCAEAVGLGYRVVVPRDCVAGTPIEYGESVLRFTLPAIAAVTSSKDIKAAWQAIEAGAKPE